MSMSTNKDHPPAYDTHQTMIELSQMMQSVLDMQEQMVSRIDRIGSTRAGRLDSPRPSAENNDDQSPVQQQVTAEMTSVLNTL